MPVVKRLTCEVGPLVTPCGQPAVIVILAEEMVVLHNGEERELLTSYPVCADHAPEEVHEARMSMHEDEFLVLTLPTDDQGRPL